MRTRSGTSVGRKANPSHETRFGPSIHALQTRSLAGIVRKRNLGPAKTRVFTPHRTNNVRPSDPEMQENVLSTEASLAFPMPCGQAPLTIMRDGRRRYRIATVLILSLLDRWTELYSQVSTLIRLQTRRAKEKKGSLLSTSPIQYYLNNW